MIDSEPERLLGLSGAFNFRDSGGYPTDDGRRVKWRHLFRSNKLSALSQEDCWLLDTLCVHTVFDLRVRREREVDPTCWTPLGLNIQTYPPGLKIPLAEMAKSYAPTEEGALHLMIEFYRAMPRTMTHVFADVIRSLAQGASPCIIHCSAGKDRTGVACALILTILGVPRKTVTMDYVLTEQLRRPYTETVQTVLPQQHNGGLQGYFPPGAERLLMSSSAHYIEAAFLAMEEDYGSVEAYVTEALNVDAKHAGMLRERLLEAAP